MLKIIVLSILFFYSCGIRKDITQLNLQKIPDYFSGSYYISADSIVSQNYQVDSITNYTNTSFTSIFNLKAKGNIFRINFTKSNMQIAYTDSSGKPATSQIKGTLKRNGHFYYKNVERNILIPVFYSKRILSKYRIWLTEEKNLVVSITHINEMNILFLGGGGTFKRHYFFKRVP